MKTAKKKLALCLAALTLLLVFTGCHGSRGLEAFEIPESFDADRPLEITFWAKNDTNKTQTAIYNRAIEEFEKLYPNVKVNIRLYTDYGRIYNDVITNISTGTTPNVCITYPDHIATYLTGPNVVVPLDGLFADPSWGFGGSELRFDGPGADEMIGKFLDECAIGGEHYAVPFMRSTEACYVNVTLLESLGYELPEVLTWDFVWEVSDKAAERDEDGTYPANGQKTMIPFIYKSTDNMMIQSLAQRGAGYSTEDGDVLLFGEDTEAILRDVAAHTGTGAFSTFKISSYPGNFLNAGQCLFAIDSTAGATWMGSHAPHSDISPDKFVEFETAVLPIPQYDPADPKMISQGPSVCVFNKADPEEVLASWLFVQYLLTNDVQIAYAQTEGYIPVTRKAQESDEYRDYLSRAGEEGELYYDVKIAATKLLLENIENTFVTPVFNGSASLRDAAGQLIENTAKSVRRHETVDDAYFEKLYSDVNSLYRLDQIGGRGAAAGREELGPLPATSVWLLSGIAAVWIAMGARVLFVWLRKKMASGAQKS
ncbi:MAG: extracellular solute-binding protein [Clostridia bacterium]|nr:extracellular solute-binding protein [Clostridia bacterium]MBQ4350677.1 extracellular solute-binding protein [Clostridia bacterium]